MRFMLVDRVIEEGADGLVAIKAISAAEEYLADHFPGFAVLPGVLMLEALVQAARQWIQSREDAPRRPVVLAEVRNVRYGQLVRPGQSLRLEVRLRKHDASGWSFQAQATVEEEVAVQGQFRLQELPGPPPAEIPDTRG